MRDGLYNTATLNSFSITFRRVSDDKQGPMWKTYGVPVVMLFVTGHLPTL